MLTGEKYSKLFEREYPRNKWQLRLKYFNRTIRGINTRFIGLFARLNKYREKGGHWELVVDGKKRPVFEKVCL